MQQPDPQIDDLLRHADWAARLARSLVGEDLAGDAVQEALTQAVAHPPGRLSSPRAWLAKVTLQRARDRGRRDRARAHRERAVAREESGRDSSDLVARAELQRRLVDHVLALPDAYRSVLLARYFDGRTPRDIARQEGVAPQTISNRLARAHGLLRERLQREQGDEKDWRGAWLPLAAFARQELVGWAGGKLAIGLGLGAALLGWGWWLQGTPQPETLALLQEETVDLVSQEPATRTALAAATPELERTIAAATPIVVQPPILPAEPRSALATVAGVALDRDEQPVANVEILLAASRYRSPRCLRNLGGEPRYLRTDGQGVFAFEEVEPGWYLLGPSGGGYRIERNDGAARRVEAGRRVAPFGEPLEVSPNAETIETTVRIWDEGQIRGRVLFSDGRPAENELVTAKRPGYGSSLSAQTNERGEFRFAHLAPGAHHLAVYSPSSGWCAPDSVRAEPGTEDVVIELQPAGRIAGRVARSTDGSSIDGWWMVIQGDGPNPGKGVSGGLDEASATFQVDNLEPAHYDVSACSDDRAWFGIRRRVAVGPGAPIEDLVVEVQPAGQLHVEHPGHGGLWHLTISDAQGTLTELGVREDARTVAVPPGSLRIHAVPERGQPHTQQLEFWAGRQTQVRLPPAR